MSRRAEFRGVKPSMASHFQSLSRGEDIDHNVHMFTEDIYLGIMPIGGRTEKRNEFSVEFEGIELECKRARIIVSQLGEFEKHD